jgi:RNA polymerase sigma factor (sigma-70 family)
MTPEERRAIHAAMVRFADGDRGAFREVFDALWPVLLAFATRSLPSHADAEDAAQRAILKLFARIVDLDRSRDGVAWAITIAAFEVLTLRRQRQRRREAPTPVEGDLADHRPSAIEQLLDQELRASLQQLIAGMSGRDREALSALLLGVKTVDEAARKRRFRAVERLRSMWRKAHG